MPKIVFVKRDGSEIIAEFPEGVSLMRGAVDCGIDDIIAECGGVASCGTCKIILNEQDSNRIPPKSAIEASMLEDDPEGWRLSCQIKMTSEMDGIRVQLPETGYL